MYIAGKTQKLQLALANLRRYCAQHLPGRCNLEIIDLLKNLQLAEGHQPLAIPILVRTAPEPMRTIIGYPSQTERLVGMEMRLYDVTS